MVKNKRKKGNNIVFIVIVAVIILVTVLIIALSGADKVDQDKVDAFAQCLTEKGTTMYGTFWCPHCAKTKKMFGPSFHYIKYVECDPRGDNEQSEFCIEKGIDKYDTWEFADGSRFISEPTFQDLAERSGCSSPQVQQ